MRNSSLAKASVTKRMKMALVWMRTEGSDSLKCNADSLAIDWIQVHMNAFIVILVDGLDSGR